MFVSLTGCLVRQKCVDRNIEPFITLGHILFLSVFIWKKISLLLGDTCPEMSKENKPSSLRYFSSWHILRIKSSWWNNSTFADRCNEQKAIDLTGKHLSLLYWYPSNFEGIWMPSSIQGRWKFLHSQGCTALSSQHSPRLCFRTVSSAEVLFQLLVCVVCRGRLSVFKANGGK